MKYLLFLVLYINSESILLCQSIEQTENNKFDYTEACKHIIPSSTFKVSTKFSDLFILQTSEVIIKYTVTYVPKNGSYIIYICEGDSYSEELKSSINEAYPKSLFLFDEIIIQDEGLETTFPKEGFITIKII